MRIHLKQPEIVEALKQYVAKQGFSLEGKTVNIDFTAGRKDAGLSADIDIEEVPFPAFDDTASEAKSKPALTVVPAPEAPKAEESPVSTPASEDAPATPAKSLFS